MIFRNDAHGVLFEKEIRLHKGCGKKITAALFLLTADYRLWQQVEPFVGTKSMDIESARPRHLNGLTYRDELRQASREKVEELVGQIRAGQYDGTGLDMLLLKLAQRLSRTKGKKVYGYLSAGTKKLVDSIVDDLAADSRISELYDLWYEQRERIIQTYTTYLPERVPLSQNGEFKAMRNAVVKAAIEVLKIEQTQAGMREELSRKDDFTSPILSQSLALLRQTARIFEDRLQEYYAPQIAHTDRKLLSKIAEKKLAQGQKLGG